ncbi:hypothetical protein Aperf_G00000048636 [Anoplocephala perfoliata]
MLNYSESKARRLTVSKAMARHRRFHRLDSDDYNDYADLIPSSLEEDSPPPYGLEHIRQSPDFNLGVQLGVPQSNQPLDFCESDFPEIDINLGNHGSSNNVGTDVSGMVAEFDNLNTADLCEGGKPVFGSGEITDHEDMAEFEIDSLLDISKKPEPRPDSLKDSAFFKNEKFVASSARVANSLEIGSKYSTDEFNVTSKTEVESLEFFRVASRLGAFLGQNRFLERYLSDRFIELLSYVHRPWSTIFLLNHPRPCTAFKFDTKMPILFDNPPEPKLPVPPLPKARAETKESLPAREVQQIPTMGSSAAIPSGGTQSSKVSNGAKVVSASQKHADRSSLLQVYQKKIASGQEKDIINLVVVGHVDAGKSTLMGNLLYQLGQVGEKQLAKFQWEAKKQGRGSFAFAWILDQTSEERSHGITMDIAQSAFETSTKRVIVIDAPGHRDFVPQVIGGAASADVALLVVNSTFGEFETGIQRVGGQTLEHARLMRLLGISRLIVAVNKMDTVDWSQARFDEICSTMTAMLKSLNLTENIFCPVSAFFGVNLIAHANPSPEKDIKKLAPWYSGPTLIEIIDGLENVDRQVDAPFRFLVSDIFKTPGSSVPIVAGRVVSGGVSAGVNLPKSKIVCLPSGQTGTVRSIRSLGVATDIEGGLLDTPQAYAFAGDQVGLMLAGLDINQALSPGDVICDADSRLVPVATRIRAKVLIFDISEPLTKGSPVIFYRFSSSISATITKLLSAVIKKKDVTKPRVLPGRCTAEIEITLESPVCVEIFEVCKPLGRFVLRSGGESVAGGTITGFVRKKETVGASQPEGK